MVIFLLYLINACVKNESEDLSGSKNQQKKLGRTVFYLLLFFFSNLPKKSGVSKAS